MHPARLRRRPSAKHYRLVAIGHFHWRASGSAAAGATQLPANFPAPLVLIQHMPAAFTKAFAERLDKLCASASGSRDGDSCVRAWPCWHQVASRCGGWPRHGEDPAR